MFHLWQFVYQPEQGGFLSSIDRWNEKAFGVCSHWYIRGIQQTTRNKEHAQKQNIIEVQVSTSQNYHKSIEIRRETLLPSILLS